MNVLLSCPSESPEVRDDRLTELKEKYSNVRFYSPGESYHNEKSNRMASLDDRKNAAKMCDALLIDWTEGEESPTVHWEHCIAWNCGNPVGVLIPEGTDPRDYLPASMYYHSDVMDPNDNVIVHKLYELVNE